MEIVTSAEYCSRVSSTLTEFRPMVLLALAMFKKPCAKMDDRDKFGLTRGGTRTPEVIMYVTEVGGLGCTIDDTVLIFRICCGSQIITPYQIILSCLLYAGVHLVSDVVEVLQRCQKSRQCDVFVHLVHLGEQKTPCRGFKQLLCTTTRVQVAAECCAGFRRCRLWARVFSFSIVRGFGVRFCGIVVCGVAVSGRASFLTPFPAPVSRFPSRVHAHAD